LEDEVLLKRTLISDLISTVCWAAQTSDANQIGVEFVRELNPFLRDKC